MTTRDRSLYGARRSVGCTGLDTPDDRLEMINRANIYKRQMDFGRRQRLLKSALNYTSLPVYDN